MGLCSVGCVVHPEPKLLDVQAVHLQFNGKPLNAG